MIVMEPVVEISDDGTALLVLGAAMTGQEVERALAVIAAASGAEGALADAECLIAPGGVQLRDAATGVRIPPGCCFGLESWRDWAVLAEGRMPEWTGHGPLPEVEFLEDGVIRMTGSQGVPQRRRGEVAGLLEGVRQALLGFLGRVARQTGPRSGAGALVRRLDEEFGVTHPG
ncbi:hypothetical protein ACFWUZ_08540 [Streptomyces sp. NPDC058646]|uniref:hypothetical protein n=1 Tax=Streptomyces sp. NPDC058646 TaxID=3346574 RepID=UPI00364F318E